MVPWKEQKNEASTGEKETKEDVHVQQFLSTNERQKQQKNQFSSTPVKSVKNQNQLKKVEGLEKSYKNNGLKKKIH